MAEYYRFTFVCIFENSLFMFVLRMPLNSLQLFPCCDSSCSCCSCDCCPDCDSVTCCCLEVRLVSKTDSIRDSSTSNPVETTGQHVADLPPRNEIRVKSLEEITPPQTPVTTRSISQLELLSSTNSYKKPATAVSKKTRASASKTTSKSQTAVNTNQKTKTVTEHKQLANARTVPLPPKLPLKDIADKENRRDSKISDARSRRLGGELIEVPVNKNKHQLSMHYNMYPYQTQNSSSYQMYSYPQSSQGTALLDSSYGMSELSGSFSSSSLRSSRPLPVPSTYG